MANKRQKLDEKFKSKVAIEALRGNKTLAQIASDYKVHPNQVSTWKRQLESNASRLFERGAVNNTNSEESLTAPLFEEIGRLKMDIRWLEKKL